MKSKYTLKIGRPHKITEGILKKILIKNNKETTGLIVFRIQVGIKRNGRRQTP